MSDESVDYLPEVYVAFRQDYPAVATALDELGMATGVAGPLDGRTAALVRLGVAVGGSSEGSVRSNARKAITEGASPAEVRQVAVLAIPTRGFPASIAALQWISEVLEA